MKCPKCNTMETKVIDSRVSEDGNVIRRRRECDYCGHRFTTFEKKEITELTVIKKDGTKEMYDRQKLKKSILLSLAKRKYNSDQLDAMISELETQRSQQGKEISSQQIGTDILKKLKHIDLVAYVRFASVYNSFETIEDFKKFLEI